MESSILVALSRQATLKRNLDVVANNMANMNTTGFKAERLLLTEQPVQIPAAGAAGDLTFVRDVATVRDFAPGELEETGGELDVALAGDGFFVADTPLGPRYTRDGHLRLDEVGQLVTEHGLPVLSADGAPIALGPEATRIVIGRDGSVSSDAGDIGRLRVVNFAHPEQLQAVEGGLMTTEEPAEDVAAPDVLQGMLERSNVEPILETRRLIEVQRSYDQARTLIDREDDRIRKMLQVYAA